MRNFRRVLVVTALLFANFGVIPAAQATVTATKIASAKYPTGFAEDQFGNIYIADESLGLVVVPAASGTLFGQSVTAEIEETLVANSGIRGIAVSATGIVVFCDNLGDVYALSSSDSMIFGESILANVPKKIKSTTGLRGGMDFDSAGNLFGVNKSNNQFSVLPASTGTLYGVSVVANSPQVLYSGSGSWFWDLAVDSAGNIFVADGFGFFGVYVLPKNSGTLFGQSVVADVFTRISAFETKSYAGIDFDSNDVLYVNIYGDRTMAISSSGRTVLETDLAANTVTTLVGTIGKVMQGLLVLQNGDLISGAFTGVFRLSAPPTTSAPAAPTIGTATALSPTSASISFSAPANNGGATIETYTATSTPGSLTGQLLQAGNGSITVTGLTPSTAYTFKVTASNSVGTSSQSSASVSITMPASDEELAEQAAAAAAQREADARAAIAAAEQRREFLKKSARESIVKEFKESGKTTIETFRQAEIAGITAENIAEVQEEILALSDEMRGDIAQVLKVARKYEVVGIIASDRVSTVYSNSLVEIGLIPQESANTSFLTYYVRKLPESERTNYAQIKAVIDSQMIKMQQRQDRLAAVKARIAAARAA